MPRPIDKKAQALNLALEAHAGKLDKAGKPYIHHLLAVARQGVNDDEFIVGVLHDFAEHDRESRLFLVKSLFDEKISEALDAISKKANESRTDYLERVAGNKLAAAVKIYDMNDTAKAERLNLLDKETRNQLIKEYVEDRAMLKMLAKG